MESAKPTRAKEANMQEVARFTSKVSRKKDCWEWQAFVNKGYGKFFYKGRTVMAHRFIYELMYKEIPKDLVIDHACDNRKCVNPLHLRLTTNVENFTRNSRFGTKDHCPKGHTFAETGIEKNWIGVRICSECRRIYHRKYYHQVVKKRSNSYDKLTKGVKNVQSNS